MGMRVSSLEKETPSSSLVDKLQANWITKLQFAKNLKQECLANLLALNMYPRGLLTNNFQGYPHPHFAENELPILLVHGILHNHSAFIRLEKKFLKMGWHNIFSINYRTSTGSIHRMTGDLQSRVDEILKATGAPQVDIVAHSLGGLVSRHFMCNGDGRGKIRNLVTLGTPHQGTSRGKVLRCIPGSSLGEDLNQNSYFIQNLISTPVPKNSRITSISSKFDWTSNDKTSFEATGIPQSNFKNVGYEHIGHTGLLYSEDVFNDILHTLSMEI